MDVAQLEVLESSERDAQNYRAQRYREWLLTLLCWDGLTPAFILILPTAVHTVWPKNDGLNTVLNLAVPIAVFFVRAAAADRHFKDNEQYGWQQFLFVLTIFMLVFFDAFWIVIENAAEPRELAAWLLFFAVYLGYVILIGVALFPFRFEWTPAAGDETDVSATS